MFKKTKLANGLRIITAPVRGTKAVTVLVLVATGSKHEKREENGISHFLEHMFFQGTRKRPNQLKIAETLDRVGGAYNAFTGKEYTGYWAKVSSSYLDLALDWVADIFLNSKIEERKIQKERKVIIEEINMYLDTPTNYIWTLWEELLYGDQPAGWPILGKKENIIKLKRRNLLDYLKKHYCPQNTIVCVTGDIDSALAERKTKEYFGKMRKTKPVPKIEVVEKQTKPQVLLYSKKTDQTHLCLGLRGYGLKDSRKYSQLILAVLLGGMMSSRLFNSVRVKAGLAYYINTTAQSYTDTGYLVTSAGVANQKLEKAINLILKEYRALKEKKIKNSELQKAKDYLKGSLTLKLEGSEDQALFYGTQELLENKILTPEQILKKIDRVTSKDIREISQEIFAPENLNLALIGPSKDKKKLMNLLKI